MNRVPVMNPHIFGVAILLGAVGWWIAMGSHDLTSHGYNIEEVGLERAKQLIDSGALVIDVRNEDAFDHRHIPGAILVPLMVLRAAIPASLESEKDKRIVIYCNEGLHNGPEATQILNEAGYTKAVNLKSGIEGWEKAGLPIQKG